MAGYSSDDEEFPLGGAAEGVQFTRRDLDDDAAALRRRLRALALAERQKIPQGAAGYTGAGIDETDPEADLESARSVRDLFVPQSPLDLGLMAAMGPGKVPVRAGLGALGMALESFDAEAALGPGFSKRFFSPLVELVRNLNVNKPMPERAWRELLEPNPKTGKQARFRDVRTGLEHPVTPDEWEFARGDEIIRDMGNLNEPISKMDLVSELEKQYPALDTKTLGKRTQGMTPAESTEWNRLNDLRSSQRTLTDAEHRRFDELFPIYQRSNQREPTQYSGYRLKGPADDASYQESLTKYGQTERRPQEWEITDSRGNPVHHQGRFATSQEAEAALESMRADTRTYPYADMWGVTKADMPPLAEGEFVPRAGHFDSEPNLLAHSRADRRTTVDGLKARHVDELQSDWHQQARDEGGYGLTEAERRELAAIEASNPDEATPELRARFEDLASRAFNEGQGRPPPAPLRKNWHEVELKKQLAQAIEDGDDLLTFTTGEQQIKRYESGLRAQVDEIRWTRSPDGKYTLVPVKGGRPVSVRTAELNNLTDRQLEDTIGTEMAKKIRESKGHDPVETKAMRAELQELERKQAAQTSSADEMTPTERRRLVELQGDIKRINAKEGETIGTLSGPDLAIGGAGMRSFYDRTVVDAAKKLAKQYGGEYTRVKVPVDQGADRLNELLGGNAGPQMWSDAGAFGNYGRGPKILDEIKRAFPHDEYMRDLGADLAQAHRIRDRQMFDSVLQRLKEAVMQDNTVGHDVHAIKITPQMREKLKATGGKFSLYADGGAIPELPWEQREDELDSHTRNDRLNHDDTPVFPTGTHLRGDDDMERLPERWRSRMPVKRDRIRRRERLELAGGGRASRELAGRVRLLMNERGSVPVSELPENTHQLLLEAAPEGFTPIYHGTNKSSVKRWREEPTYFTDREGVAEAYARTKWPQDPENFGASAKNPSIGAFLVSDDDIGRSLRDVDVTNAQLDMLRKGDDRGFSELLSQLFDDLPGKVNKARLRNAVPLSRSMLEERSPEFLRDLYGASPTTLRKYLERWEADPYRPYDHYYVKEPSSLRRWKRGGRT